MFDVETKQLRIEISTIISQDSVIARNSGSIAITDAGPVFNEWVVPQEDIEAKYDEGTVGLLTTTFPCIRRNKLSKLFSSPVLYSTALAYQATHFPFKSLGLTPL